MGVITSGLMNHHQKGRPSVSNFTASFTEDPYKQVKGANKLPSTKRKEIKRQKKRKEEIRMNTSTVELNLNELEMVTGGWNWKKSVFWGVFGTVIGASIGAQIGGGPGAVAGAIIGGGAGVATGDE